MVMQSKLQKQSKSITELKDRIKSLERFNNDAQHSKVSKNTTKVEERVQTCPADFNDSNVRLIDQKSKILKIIKFYQ